MKTNSDYWWKSEGQRLKRSWPTSYKIIWHKNILVGLLSFENWRATCWKSKLVSWRFRKKGKNKAVDWETRLSSWKADDDDDDVCPSMSMKTTTSIVAQLWREMTDESNLSTVLSNTGLVFWAWLSWSAGLSGFSCCALVFGCSSASLLGKLWTK